MRPKPANGNASPMSNFLVFPPDRGSGRHDWLLVAVVEIPAHPRARSQDDRVSDAGDVARHLPADDPYAPAHGNHVTTDATEDRHRTIEDHHVPHSLPWPDNHRARDHDLVARIRRRRPGGDESDPGHHRGEEPEQSRHRTRPYPDARSPRNPPAKAKKSSSARPRRTRTPTRRRPSRRTALGRADHAARLQRPAHRRNALTRRLTPRPPTRPPRPAPLPQRRPRRARAALPSRRTHPRHLVTAGGSVRGRLVTETDGYWYVGVGRNRLRALSTATAS